MYKREPHGITETHMGATAPTRTDALITLVDFCLDFMFLRLLSYWYNYIKVSYYAGSFVFPISS